MQQSLTTIPDFEPPLQAPAQERPRAAVAHGQKPEADARLQKLGDLAREFRGELSDPAAAKNLGGTAAVSITVGLVAVALDHSLAKLTALSDDTQREAAAFLRKTVARSDILQAQIESYARICGEAQHQIKIAGQRVPT